MARLKPGRHQKADLSKSLKKTTSNSEVKITMSSSSSKTEHRKKDLRQQIEELGGDEDDYKLVENADSDLSDIATRVGNSRKPQDSRQDVTLHSDIANIMKELNFSRLGGTSNVTRKVEERGKNDSKVSKPTKGSNTKIQASDGSSKASFDRRSENTTREKVTRFSEAKLATTAQHIKFSQNETETRPHSSHINSKAKLVLTPSPHWYSTPLALPLRPTAIPPLSSDLSGTYQTRAQSLIEADAETYLMSSAHTSSTSDAKFISRILSSGTLSDRLSALTLMIQASPLHNIRALETLKGMAGKKGREESLKASRAIVDWWIGGGAPDRKLKYFRDQPLAHPDTTDAHIALWFFEDWLKKYFFNILEILENLAADPLSYVRKQAMHFIFQLLRDKPEQEQNLLRLLVHKLNDSEKSIASKASHYILQVLQLHPKMKKIVIQEIAGFVLRPVIVVADVKSTSDKTHPPKSPAHSHFAHCRYYAAITFNQLVLTFAESAVADLLVDIYFGMFKEILGDVEDKDKQNDRDYRPKNRRGHMDRKNKSKSSRKPDGTFYTDNVNITETDHNARLVSAILTGINRALPFAGEIGKTAKFASHINTLFRITHASSTTFAVSLQALMLLFHVCTNPKFSSASSTTSSTQTIMTTSSLPSRFYRTLYASLLDTRLSHFASSSKHAIYLNLLLKAIRSDPEIQTTTGQMLAPDFKSKNQKKSKLNAGNASVKTSTPPRPSALTKRYLQILLSGTGSGGRNEVMCAGLFFIGELMNFAPSLIDLIDKIPSARTQIQEIPMQKTRDNLNELKKRPLYDPGHDENYDVSDLTSEKKSGSPLPNADPKSSGSSVQSVLYDPKKRDPQYANAEHACLWELIPLQLHYHPSVSLHARQLLTHLPVTATPDLGLNTLSHFLDRFVYKNAKKKLAQKGTSAMQRTGTENQAEIEVNTDQFKKLKKGDVPVDQLFFHNFFTLKHGREIAKSTKADKRKKKISANSDVEKLESRGTPASDDEEEQEIWKAMKKSIPELEISDNEDGEHDAADINLIEDAEDEEKVGDDDGSALDFIEDIDDLISETGSLKGLIPGIALDEPGNDEDNEMEWRGFDSDDEDPERQGSGKHKKRNREGNEGKKKKKRRTGIDTFASYDDYRDMIENTPEDYF